MAVVKNQMRYQLLEKQFHIDPSHLLFQRLNDSLDSIFFYVYNYTDIMYIDCITKDVLYDYIKYCRVKNVQGHNYIQAITDVKNYLIFLERVQRIYRIPKVDLSVKNSIFWSQVIV